MPYLLLYCAMKLVMGRQRAFIAASEHISNKAGYFGLYARDAYYVIMLPRVGKRVYIGMGTLFSKADATLGDGVYIGRRCSLGLVELQDDVMLADGVQILSGRYQHGKPSEEHNKPMRDNEQQYQKVTIGRGAWIGANAVVMADVGDHAVVGAGAVVVKPVEAGQRVGGVPAKPLQSSPDAALAQGSGGEQVA